MHREGILLNCKRRGEQRVDEYLVSLYFLARFVKLYHWLEKDFFLFWFDAKTVCASQGSHSSIKRIIYCSGICVKPNSWCTVSCGKHAFMLCYVERE